MTACRLIVFDVDGTLVDSQHHIQTAMSAAFGALGLVAPTLAQTRQVVGLSLPEAMARLVPEADATLRDELVTAYKDSFGQVRSRDLAPLFPGARAVLDELAGRDDVLLGVATGKSRRGLEHVIREHGLHGIFATRQVADDHPSKPHPAMLEAALAETDVEPARALMIGDTSFDMLMGRAAGVATVGVTWGYHDKAALVQAGADRLAHDFSELLTLIDGDLA